MFFAKKSSVRRLLTPDNEKDILHAIRQAEQMTSGEIRVHIESTLKGKSPLDAAVKMFDELGMQKTAHRNGVLIFIVLDDRQFAIIGDRGIDEKVGQDFWDDEKDRMTSYFKKGDIIEGIVFAVGQVGEKLKEFFPYQNDDVNELRDEISVGEEEEKP